MKLEEAKKVLLIIRANIEFELQFIYADKTIAKLKEYIQAIDVSISELVALQNLLDEKREEIEHLQKENKKLQSFKDDVIETRKDFPSLDMDDCVNIAIEIDNLLRWE